MNTDHMNSAAVVTFTGSADDLEDATDVADERMNSFIQDNPGFDRLVVSVSTQLIFANNQFHCAISVLYRF